MEKKICETCEFWKIIKGDVGKCYRVTVIVKKPDRTHRIATPTTMRDETCSGWWEKFDTAGATATYRKD